MEGRILPARGRNTPGYIPRVSSPHAAKIATCDMQALETNPIAPSPPTVPSPATSTVRIIAAYLPQFHPIPENDEWWGTGFTEWTNVRNARKLFRHHYQPRAPADLGYYDLRQPESRQAQAELAETYGVEGFCYWHYWFGNGRRLLERPFNEVLSSGTPTLPFCLAWANHSWKDKTFKLGGRERVLIEQLYPGIEDYILHFNTLLPAFKDRRYIRVDGKPLFYVYGPGFIPTLDEFVASWRQLARDNGLEGIHLVAQTYDARKIELYLNKGFDAVNIVRLFDFAEKHYSPVARAFVRLRRQFFKRGQIIDYEQVYRYFVGEEEKRENCYPCILPNWDPSPRTGRKGHVFINSTPSSFKKHVMDVLRTVRSKNPEHRIIFLKSWNEWAEGNYMEPDMRFGRGYLESLKEAMIDTGYTRVGAVWHAEHPRNQGSRGLVL